jgi:hypothetical protein
MADCVPLHRNMAEPLKPGAKQSSERAARAERLAKALRENLRRRKEQARARQQCAPTPPENPAGGDREPPA